MKRIGWQGVSRAKALGACLEGRLVRWREGWLQEQWSDASVLPCDSLGTSEMSANRRCWRLEVDGATLWFEAGASTAMELGFGALKLDESADGSLIEAVGISCFSRLCADLWGDTVPERLVLSESIDIKEREPAYGALCFQIMGLPGSILITANRAWCERQIPASQGANVRVPLSDRREALGRTIVTVSAAIDLGDIPLVESLGWTVGELLVTDVPRKPPVSLASSLGQVGIGTLASHQGVRTVVIA
jgi:hypothetical protein